MQFFADHVGFLTVLRISELMVASDHNNVQEEEWKHIRGFLHDIKSQGYLSVENEGQDIHHEKFASTPDKIKKYFSKDLPQDNSDLSKKTDEELEEIIRKGVNADISGSLHNRALTEIDIRHRKKIEAALLGVKAVPERGKTVKADYKTAEAFVQSRTQGDDQHILMGKRDGTPGKAHMIIDKNDGSQRLEGGQQEPTEIAPLIETYITFPNGDRIKATREKIEEAGSEGIPVIEVEKIGFNGSARTKEKLAETFSVSIPILIKNFSNGKITVRDIRVSLQVPDGYDCSIVYTDAKSQEDIAAKDFVSRTFLFSVAISGRAGGIGPHNPVWEACKNKVIAEINSAKFILHVKAGAVSLKGTAVVEKSFDLTSEILPELIKS